MNFKIKNIILSWIILKGWQIGIEYFRLCSLGMCWMLSSSSTASHRWCVLCHKIRIVIVFHWSWLISVNLTSNALTPFLSTSGIFLGFYLSLFSWICFSKTFLLGIVLSWITTSSRTLKWWKAAVSCRLTLIKSTSVSEKWDMRYNASWC